MCVRRMIFLHMPIWRWYNDNEIIFFILYTHVYYYTLLQPYYMIPKRGVCGMTRFLFGIWIRSPGHESYWSKRMWWHGRHEKVFALNRRGVVFIIFGVHGHRKFTADARAENNGKSLGQAVSLAPRFWSQHVQEHKKNKDRMKGKLAIAKIV